VLEDTKHVFGVQNIAPIVSNKVIASEGTGFAEVVNAVSAKLTTAAMRAMNNAVAIDKQTPAVVAGAFLKANGLG
jgi:osmoprotectant transport system substrate-binding protein